MKKILFLLIMFLSFDVLVKAQQADSSKLHDYGKYISALTEKIEKQDSTISIIANDLISVKKENDLYTKALDINSNLFDGTSMFFTIVSILLSIIVIAIPVINYFLVLKPNAVALAKIQNIDTDIVSRIESNFEKYFERLRIGKRKKIIQMLSDRSSISAVTSFLFLNYDDALDNDDTIKIIDFLKNNDDIEDGDKMVLNSAVNFENPFSEQYYKSVLDNEVKSKYKYAIEYFVDNNFKSHIPYLTKIIQANENGHNLLIDIYDCIADKFVDGWMDKKAPEKRQIGIDYTKLLFDDENIIKAINGKPFPNGTLSKHRINSNRINLNPTIKETIYYQTYLEKKD